MVADYIYVICYTVLFVQIATSQSTNDFPQGLLDSMPFHMPDVTKNWASNYGPSSVSYGFNPIGQYGGLTPSNGGGFTVTSYSPTAPTGLTVTSENAIEGALAVMGNMPFLGTVSMEGAFQSAGAGAVSYGCGSGNIGIIAEGPIDANGQIIPGYSPATPTTYGTSSIGYGPGVPLPYNGRSSGAGY